MKGRLFSIIFSCILLFSSSAFAQQKIEIDLEGLTAEQKAKILLQAEDLKKMKKKNSASVVESVTDDLTNPSKLNEWVDLGKNVGLALTAVAKELGVASDQFLKSDTGKIALVLIVWKVMGEDILDIVGGVSTWFVVAPVIIWSFSFFHMAKRVKSKDKDKIEYVQRYAFRSNEARNASAIFHALSFVGLTLVCMAIVFA